jgi:hypothetical protein
LRPIWGYTIWIAKSNAPSSGLNVEAKGHQVVSAHISESGVEYVGIINGVTYRIGPATGAIPQSAFARTPFGVQPFSPTQWLIPIEPPQPVTTSPDEARTAAAVQADAAPAIDPLVDQARAEREARAAKLFKRDSAEPLRAGHPDLWALLVAGTCLEGSTFEGG